MTYLKYANQRIAGIHTKDKHQCIKETHLSNAIFKDALAHINFTLLSGNI
jgi:hypothetical protein